MHYLLGAAYFLPLLLAPATCLAAVLSRLLLFDPTLNLAAGDAVFAVGQTAASNRAMQWLAQRVGYLAERVRMVAWGLCLGVTCYLLFIIM